MRLASEFQGGFIFNDFPQNVQQAEMLEEYKGGLNAMVHFSFPSEVLVEIESVKTTCTNCEKVYYAEDVINEEHGIRIEKFMPKDGICDDCGSTKFERVHNLEGLEKDMEAYNENIDDLLAFYNHYGLLVDY
jgi:adenylate kinase family enzyme